MNLKLPSCNTFLLWCTTCGSLGSMFTKETGDTIVVHTSAKRFVATTCFLNLGVIMKTYLRASDGSRLKGPSKDSPPSPLSERCDHKGDFLGLFMKTEFSGVSSRASRPYRSGSLNTWHLLFSSASGSQVWKGDKVLIVVFLPPFFDGSRGHWSETTCLSRCLPGYSFLPGSLPTSLRWLIKVLHHQTLMLTRFACT